MGVAVLVIHHVGDAVHRYVEAIDLARNGKRLVQCELELLLHARAEFARRKPLAAGECHQIVQHGIAQALGVVARGNLFLFDSAREDFLEERRDILERTLQIALERGGRNPRGFLFQECEQARRLNAGPCGAS